MSNVRHLRPAAAFTRGDLVTYQHLPMIVVYVRGDYADLAPGDTLATASTQAHTLTHVSKLARRTPVIEHYVTIEPVVPAGDDDAPPRLCIAEHRSGEPVWVHGTEGWLPLGELPVLAREVAGRLGVEFREPTDELAVELLGAGA